MVDIREIKAKVQLLKEKENKCFGPNVTEEFVNETKDLKIEIKQLCEQYERENE